MVKEKCEHFIALTNTIVCNFWIQALLTQQTVVSPFAYDKSPKQTFYARNGNMNILISNYMTNDERTVLYEISQPII